MKKGIHSKIVDLMDVQTMTKYPGYILNYPNLQSPVFVNENVWKNADEEYNKRKDAVLSSIPNIKNSSKNKSSKIYDMLYYSSGKFNDKFGGASNGYEAGLYRPLTSPDQIKFTTKKKISPEENINKLKSYLTEAFNIHNRDEFAKKQIQSNKNKNKTNMILLKAVEDNSTYDNEPPSSILKKNAKAEATHLTVDNPFEKIKKPKEITLESDVQQKSVRKKTNRKSKSKIEKKAMNNSCGIERKTYPSVASVHSQPKPIWESSAFVKLPEVPLHTSRKKNSKLLKR